MENLVVSGYFDFSLSFSPNFGLSLRIDDSLRPLSCEWSNENHFHQPQTPWTSAEGLSPRQRTLAEPPKRPLERLFVHKTSPRKDPRKPPQRPTPTAKKVVVVAFPDSRLIGSFGSQKLLTAAWGIYPQPDL